ncbi:14195_t:CDS:1, partial [Gigaspora rosea]
EYKQINEKRYGRQIQRRTLQRLKEYQKAIRKARQFKNRIQQREQINYYVNKRYNDFSTSTKQMINSILKRRTNKVELHNIVTEMGIATDVNDIKEEVKKHYEKWMKLNEPNTMLW